MLRLKATLAAGLALGAATFALAEASDPVVKARQDAMGMIGANTKILGQMAQGQTAFDAAAAQAAFSVISQKAAEVPSLFEVEADDPESEAKAEIWFMYDDFVTKSEALKAAADAGLGVDSPEFLGAAMGPLSGSCKACHSEYKM